MYFALVLEQPRYGSATAELAVVRMGSKDASSGESVGEWRG
jgi:hypothetical protein